MPFLIGNDFIQRVLYLRIGYLGTVTPVTGDGALFIRKVFLQQASYILPVAGHCAIPVLYVPVRIGRYDGVAAPLGDQDRKRLKMLHFVFGNSA